MLSVLLAKSLTHMLSHPHSPPTHSQGRGVAIDAVSTTTAEGAGAGGAAATAVETTPEYERESVEDVMATLVTMEATGDTDDEESSTDESGLLS